MWILWNKDTSIIRTVGGGPIYVWVTCKLKFVPYATDSQETVHLLLYLLFHSYRTWQGVPVCCYLTLFPPSLLGVEHPRVEVTNRGRERSNPRANALDHQRAAAR